MRQPRDCLYHTTKGGQYKIAKNPKLIPIEMQCIPHKNYIAKQTVCTAVVMLLYMLSGGAMALGLIPPLLTGALPVWRMCLSVGFAAVSAILWRLGRWTERSAL